jgi:hypothetical protein
MQARGVKVSPARQQLLRGAAPQDDGEQEDDKEARKGTVL